MTKLFTEQEVWEQIQRINKENLGQRNSVLIRSYDD